MVLGSEKMNVKDFLSIGLVAIMFASCGSSTPSFLTNEPVYEEDWGRLNHMKIYAQQTLSGP